MICILFKWTTGHCDLLFVNRKTLSLLVVIWQLLFYHGCFSSTVDQSNCQVLQNGYFKNDSFQPGDCKLHRYSQSDIKMCLKQHHSLNRRKPLLAFIGDSRVRQRFIYMKGLLENATYHYKAIHKDIFHPNSSQVSLEFRWRPKKDIASFMTKWWDLYKNATPSYAIVGVALHFIEPAPKDNKIEIQKQRISEYKNILDKVLPTMSSMKGTKFVWMLQEPGPMKYKKGDQIKIYNEIAMQKLYQHNVTAWSSTLDTGRKYRDAPGRPNILHSGIKMLYWDSHTLLNLVCNEYLRPQDATCCFGPKLNRLNRMATTYMRLPNLTAASAIRFKYANDVSPETLQYSFAILFIIGIIISVLLEKKVSVSIYKLLNPQKSQNISVESSPNSAQPAETSVKAITKKNDSSQKSKVVEAGKIFCKYGAILLYFYFCDRVDVFDTKQKHYLPQYFYAALGIMLFLGLISIRKTDKTDILNRQQTDEWKGWMQLVILTYHYTGTSQNLHIYMYIRVLVSAYLFMTGFGHVAHALKHKDLPVKHIVKRICEVLFRMNLLTVSLCLVMQKTYQFYYFVPLVSFLFLCVMLITWLPLLIARYCKSDQIPALYGGVFTASVTLFIVNTLLHYHKFVFHFIFSLPLVNTFFKTDDGSLYEWYFRWSIDRYSSIYGVFCGTTLLLYQQFKPEESSKSSKIIQLLLLVPLGVLGIMTYIFAGKWCTTKEECNSVHAFVTAIPIVSFVVLRNICNEARQYHCSFFAWIGTISLELFISQYHIWLAADTKELLVVIPGYPTINLAVTSITLLCVALQIKDVTGRLTKLLFY